MSRYQCFGELTNAVGGNSKPKIKSISFERQVHIKKYKMKCFVDKRFGINKLFLNEIFREEREYDLLISLIDRDRQDRHERAVNQYLSTEKGLNEQYCSAWSRIRYLETMGPAINDLGAAYYAKSNLPKSVYMKQINSHISHRKKNTASLIKAEIFYKASFIARYKKIPTCKGGFFKHCAFGKCKQVKY